MPEMSPPHHNSYPNDISIACRIRRSSVSQNGSELRFGSVQEMTCIIRPPLEDCSTVSHDPLPEMLFFPVTTSIKLPDMGRSIRSRNRRSSMAPLQRKGTMSPSSLLDDNNNDDDEGCSYSSLSLSPPRWLRQCQEQESSCRFPLRLAFNNIHMVHALGDPYRKLIVTLPSCALEIDGLTRNAYDIVLACFRTWLDPQIIQEFVLDNDHTSSPPIPQMFPSTTALSCCNSKTDNDDDISDREYSVDALTNDIMLLAAARESITDKWGCCMDITMADISELVVDVVSMDSNSNDNEQTATTALSSCNSKTDNNNNRDLEYSVVRSNDIVLLTEESITDKWERCIDQAMTDFISGFVVDKDNDIVKEQHDQGTLTGLAAPTRHYMIQFYD